MLAVKPRVGLAQREKSVPGPPGPVLSQPQYDVALTADDPGRDVLQPRAERLGFGPVQQRRLGLGTLQSFQERQLPTPSARIKIGLLRDRSSSDVWATSTSVR